MNHREHVPNQKDQARKQAVANDHDDRQVESPAESTASIWRSMAAAPPSPPADQGELTARERPSEGWSAGLPSPRDGIRQRQRNILYLQRTVGNQAVQRYLDRKDPLVQRQNEGVTAEPSWSPPRVFEIETRTITTRLDAGVAVVNMMGLMDRLESRLPDDRRAPLHSASHSGLRLARQLGGGGDLTADDVAQLNIFSSYARSATQNGLNYLSSQIQRPLEPMQRNPRSHQLGTVKAKLAEKLHSDFMSGSTDDTVLSQVNDAFNNIMDYEGHAERVTTWARRASTMFGRNRVRTFLENLEERTEIARNGLSRFQNLLNAASALQHLFRMRGSSGAQADISRFREGLNLIDASMSLFEAVPLLGDLWSDFYRPMTDNILSTLERIFQLQDLDSRRLALGQMASRHRDPLAPLIPPSERASFPGGQHVLNFMYAVMNDGNPRVTPVIERFFVQHVPQFNAAHTRDPLETESGFEILDWSTWLDSRQTALHLLEWVERNRQTVWAQLYGDIPPDFADVGDIGS